MAEDDADDDLYYEQRQLIGDLVLPTSSMVVIRESPGDCVVFPPINHENLHEFSSESESISSSSRRSGSFSSFPSDSDGQPPCETEDKSPIDSDGKSSLTTCEFDRKSPQSLSEHGGESPPSGKSLRKPLYHQVDVFQDWCEFLLLRVNSKLKTLVTWFSTNLRSFYPLIAIAIWWLMRVRARRKRLQGESVNRLEDAIKERDEKIVKLLHQIAQMNELLVKHHKDIVSRR